MFAVIFKRTGLIRVFEEKDLAHEWYNSETIYDCREHFDIDYSTYENIFYWAIENGFNIEGCEDPKTSTKEGFWIDVIRIVNQIKPVTVSRKMTTGKKAYGFRINLPLARHVNNSGAKTVSKNGKKGSGQLVRLIKWFALQNKDYYSRKELKEALESTRYFDTKQVPWRLFRYYRAELIHFGIIKEKDE